MDWWPSRTERCFVARVEQVLKAGDRIDDFGKVG
jgi:hypothetical protein